MYTRAKNIQDERLKKVTNWDDVVPTLDAKNILVLPWCEQESCEDDIKERSKSQYVPSILSPFPARHPPSSYLSSIQERDSQGIQYTDKTGQTREKQKTSKLPLQVLNHFVSPTIKLDLENSQRVKTRNVFSVVKRQRGGLCLEGVSTLSCPLRRGCAD
jgi:hypothetical protein